GRGGSASIVIQPPVSVSSPSSTGPGANAAITRNLIEFLFKISCGDIILLELAYLGLDSCSSDHALRHQYPPDEQAHNYKNNREFHQRKSCGIVNNSHNAFLLFGLFS